MNIHSHNALASSNGSSVRKPKGIYLLSDLHLDQIYGPDAQAEITKRIDISTSLITAERYKNGDETWPGVEMIFSGWGMTVMNEEFLSRFPDLKIVFYGAGSVKPHVTEAFWKSGIRITNAAAANAIPVAEYACAQIIQALKRGWQTSLYIRRERKFPQFYTPPGAFQTTVGLLSLGMVGRMVAERLRNHDLKVVAYDPYVTPEQAETLNVTLLPLSEVFAQANVVSCHMPWLPETRRVIRGNHFESLKPNATFINTARGAVVAEDEMIEVLRQRPDILAILDVTYPEPPVEGSPLYLLDNVVLTPHIAGSMGDECRRMGHYMVEELDRYLSGLPLRNELTDEIAAITA
jgi:phosphoglycerate dehydrogenase-like enzyme